MELVLKALDYAREKHAGQFRRTSKLPYITHPVAVSYIVASFKKSKHHEELLAACILHDVIEDTEATFVELVTMFGPLVSSIVQELTNDEAEIARIGKLEYHKTKLVGISSYALVIKLADRLDNMRDSPKAQAVSDTIKLMTHIKKNRRLSSTHKKLVTAIEETINKYQSEEM